MAEAHDFQCGFAVEVLEALGDVNFQILRGVFVVHIERDFKIYAADGVDDRREPGEVDFHRIIDGNRHLLGNRARKERHTADFVGGVHLVGLAVDDGFRIARDTQAEHTMLFRVDGHQNNGITAAVVVVDAREENRIKAVLAVGLGGAVGRGGGDVVGDLRYGFFQRRHVGGYLVGVYDLQFLEHQSVADFAEGEEKENDYRKTGEQPAGACPARAASAGCRFRRALARGAAARGGFCRALACRLRGTLARRRVRGTAARRRFRVAAARRSFCATLARCRFRRAASCCRLRGTSAGRRFRVAAACRGFCATLARCRFRRTLAGRRFCRALARYRFRVAPAPVPLRCTLARPLL